MSRLAINYYRPDFQESQAKLIIRGYIEDLMEFEVSDVEEAIREYRRGKDAKFWPAVGELIALAKVERRERLARAAAKRRPIPSKYRPILWWGLPKSLWQPHWRETEVPMGEKIRDRTGEPMRDPELVVF